MKKILFSLGIFCLLSANLNAQGPGSGGNSNASSQWRTMGNAASQSDFVGTTNSQDLIFRTNNLNRGRFNAGGDFVVENGGRVLINVANPVANLMFQLNGDGVIGGELTGNRGKFVKLLIQDLRPDTIHMDTNKVIHGHTKVLGDVRISGTLTGTDATFSGTLSTNILNSNTFTTNSLDLSQKLSFGGGAANLGFIPASGANNNVNVLYVAKQGPPPPPPGSNTCLMPQANSWMMQVPDALQLYSSAGTSTGKVLLQYDAVNGVLETMGFNVNTQTPKLLLNYYCGNDVAICTGTGAPGSPGPNGTAGGFVFTGPNMQIGSPISNRNSATALNIASNTGITTALNIDANGTNVFKVNSDGGTFINLTNPQPNASVLTMTHANGSTFKVLANGTGDITSSSAFSAHFGSGAQDNFAIYQGAPGSGIQHFYMAGGTGTSHFRTTDGNTSGTAFMIVNNQNTSGTGANNQVLTIANDGATIIKNHYGTTSSPFTIQNTVGNLFQVDGTGNTSISTNAYFQSGNPTDNIRVKHDGLNALIDASGSGSLLLNYISGKDVDICTGASGFLKTGANVQIGGVIQNKNSAIALNIGYGGSINTAINVDGASNTVFKVSSDGTTLISSTSPSAPPLTVFGQAVNKKLLEVLPTGNTYMTIAANQAQVQDAFRISNLTNTGVFTVRSDGSTYIGQKVPNTAGQHADALLAVYGKALFTSAYVNVHASIWSDYVFAKNYVLMDLFKVEDYYLQYKHLPGVPSAAEMEEKGDNLVETDAILLKKIEENTIYLVQLKKEIEELKKENAELKKLVK